MSSIITSTKKGMSMVVRGFGAVALCFFMLAPLELCCLCLANLCLQNCFYAAYQADMPKYAMMQRITVIPVKTKTIFVSFQPLISK